MLSCQKTVAKLNHPNTVQNKMCTHSQPKLTSFSCLLNENHSQLMLVLYYSKRARSRSNFVCSTFFVHGKNSHNAIVFFIICVFQLLYLVLAHCGEMLWRAVRLKPFTLPRRWIKVPFFPRSIQSGIRRMGPRQQKILEDCSHKGGVLVM